MTLLDWVLGWSYPIPILFNFTYFVLIKKSHPILFLYVNPKESKRTSFDAMKIQQKRCNKNEKENSPSLKWILIS